MRRQLFPIELETGYVLTVFLISRKDWNSPLYAAMPLYRNIKKTGFFMKEEIRILVNYRLERAKESIEEAKILVERGHVNTFINALLCMLLCSFWIVTHERIVFPKT